MNGSRTDGRGFSALPRRGALALVTTVLAVALLFSFKPADQTTALSGAGLPTMPPIVGGQPRPTQQTTALGPPAATRAPTTGSGPTRAPGATQPPRTPTQQPTSPPAVGNGVSGTFTGDAIDTPYGTVQVALVVQDGQIVDVQELQLPNDRRLSAQISSEAGPILRDEVITAQGDNINSVSGASYTSYGFYKSLQSALHQI